MDRDYIALTVFLDILRLSNPDDIEDVCRQTIYVMEKVFSPKPTENLMVPF